MAYTYKYADNASYGTDDIKDTLAMIVTGGVADTYFDGVTFNNCDTSQIGAYISKCEVNAYATGQVKVSAGEIFFQDGSKFRIGTDGIILSYTSGSINYVYAKNNLASAGTINVICSTTQGTDDYVPLAIIAADDTITDARIFYDSTGGYSPSIFNNVANFLTTSGINYGSSTSLIVVKYTGGTNQVKVCAGSAFFDDGSSVTVDSEGVILTYTSGSINYVYLVNNLSSTNTVDIVCSTTAGSGDYIPLATIAADGTITDTRTYCKGKLTGFLSDSNHVQVIDLAYTITGVTSVGKSYTGTIDLGDYGYSHIINISGYKQSSSRSGMALWDIENDAYYSVYETSEYRTLLNSGDSGFMYVYYRSLSNGDNEIKAHFSISGTVLTYTLTAYYGSGSSSTFEGTINLLIC